MSNFISLNSSLIKKEHFWRFFFFVKLGLFKSWYHNFDAIYMLHKANFKINSDQWTDHDKKEEKKKMLS